MNKRTHKFLTLSFSALLVSGSLFFSSCDNKENGEDPTPDNGFSELTVEENKQNLEEAGLELVTNVNELKDAPGLEASAAFVSFFAGSDEEEVPGGRQGVRQAVGVMQSLADLRSGKATPSQVLKNLGGLEEDFTSLQDGFDSLAGTFTYDAEIDDWNHVAGGNAIIFEFPSTEEGTENNAELKIHGFEVTTIENPEAEYSGEAPTALTVDLKVDGAIVVQYLWEAEYKANGEPEMLATSIAIGAFKFAVELENTTTDVGFDYAFTKGTQNLISFGASAEGNFTAENIEANEEVIEEIVYSAEAHVQLLNILVAGDVDVAQLAPAANEADANDDEEALAVALDEHTNLVVSYADSGDKIAETEFYFSTETDDVSLRLIFADESKQDIETYVEDGFADLETEIEALFEDLGLDMEDEGEIGG